MIGKQLLHYEIREQLGRGGMGEVFLAHDEKLGRDVAIKILPPEVADDAERRSRFLREAKAVAALSHPNIVTIHAVEEAGGVLFIVMEFVDGSPFSELIPRGGFGLEQLFAYATPLADALASAHDKNITHRDLKPANIMLDSAGRVRVLDFGLAKLLASNDGEEDAETVVRTSDTAAGIILGTAAYMSPEQAEGKQIDRRSDIFSLGIVLYEMATGERPFKGDTRISTISSVLKDDPPRVTQINQALPHHLGRIVHHCLEKDPDRRYQSAKDVRNELEALQREIQSGELVESSVMTQPPQTAPGSAPPSPPTPATVTPPPTPYPTPPPASAHPSEVRQGTQPPARKPGRGRSVALVAVVAVVVLAGIWLARTLAPGGDTSGTAAVDNTAGRTGTAVAPASETGKKMAVVLPFENLGPPEDAYFAAGMTEEITTRLARVSDLGVISRTSAVNYDRSGKTMRDIGEDLGVEYVLEGSVRWAKSEGGAGRVRITPQLIRASDDRHLWSDTYDREVTDIFEVQSEIATKVIEALGVTLLGGEREMIAAKPTDNMAAYELYMKAIDYAPRPGVGLAEADRELTDMYERAVELDPGFVLAWYRLARHHADQYRVFDQTEARLAKAKAAVAGAEAADPNHYATHLARGYYYYYGFRDYDLALKEFQSASALVPNDADALAAIGYIYRRQGKLDQSIEAHQEALELDPKNREVALNMASTLGALRDFDSALAMFDRVLEDDPRDPTTLTQKAETLVRGKGDLEAAAACMERVSEKGSVEFIFASYFQAMTERDYLRAVEAISALPEGSAVFQGAKRLLTGVARLRSGESEAARSLLETGVAKLAPIVQASPSNWQIRQMLATGYAALGRDDEAIREARTAVDLAAKDLYSGGQAQQNLAQVYAIVGRHEEAIDLIERLLRKNYERPVTIHSLKLDPVWDPLRNNPRFQAIVNAPSEL